MAGPEAHASIPDPTLSPVSDDFQVSNFLSRVPRRSNVDGILQKHGLLHLRKMACPSMLNMFKGWEAFTSLEALARKIVDI